jgi:hypothetical protein
VNRAVVFIAVLVIAIQAFTIIEGARLYNALHGQVQSQCGFLHDLGNVAAVPVSVNPATHKASKVGVAIIADSRSAFRSLSCPGQLTKPGPSFVHWARFYKLPVN